MTVQEISIKLNWKKQIANDKRVVISNFLFKVLLKIMREREKERKRKKQIEIKIIRLCKQSVMGKVLGKTHGVFTSMRSILIENMMSISDAVCPSNNIPLSRSR